MRIAYLADHRSSNAYYRAIGPMEALAARGHRVTRLPTTDTRPPASVVAGHDLLLIHRYSERRAQQLAEAAHAQGSAVVWDNDDDMGAVTKDMVAYRITGGLRWEQRLAGMRRIFRVADLVTAPSPVLADRLRRSGASRVEVLENQIPDEVLHPRRAAHTDVAIGWIAGPEHQLDVDRIPIRAAVERLLDERPDVRFESIGLRLGVSHARCTNEKFVPLLELAQAAARWDVAVAPLAELDFNLARSDVKLKEYAAAGTPWLASPTGPYARMGERQGGRLVPDDGWHEELSRLVDKPRERRKLGKRAAKWAAGETMSGHAHRWEALFGEVVGAARAAA